MSALPTGGPKFSVAGLVAAICTIASLLAGSPAFASGRGLAPVPAMVHAGAVIELRWSDLPADAEELEILLSLDDGEHFAIRVSPELEAHERRFRWRVPNLPAERARLRVRVGDNHGHEWWLDPGDAFRIVEDLAPAREPDFEPAPMREGNWWLGPEPSTRANASCLTPAPSATFEAREGELVAEVVPRVSAPRAPALPSPLGFAAGRESGIAGARFSSFHAPRRLPLRN
jgi:hypothetical protein